MAEPRIHDIAQAKAAKLLKKRTPSVSSAISVGTEHRKRRGYAASVSTVSYMDNPHDDELMMRQTSNYENTYRMEPMLRFPTGHIDSILHDSLSSHLHDKKYEPELCRKMTKVISDDVKARVKEMNIPRYKIICLIYIGQLNNQGLRIGSRCLWNAKFDTFSSCKYSNSSIFAVASVYGVYFE